MMLSLYFFCFLHACAFLSFPCEHTQNQDIIQATVKDIKGRVEHFHSVWCKGHEYFHLIPLDSKVYAILENSPDVGLEMENTNDFEIAFTCDKKNFFYI